MGASTPQKKKPQGAGAFYKWWEEPKNLLTTSIM